MAADLRPFGLLLVLAGLFLGASDWAAKSAAASSVTGLPRLAGLLRAACSRRDFGDRPAGYLDVHVLGDREGDDRSSVRLTVP